MKPDPVVDRMVARGVPPLAARRLVRMARKAEEREPSEAEAVRVMLRLARAAGRARRGAAS